MSSFKCEICHKDIIDTAKGYVTECPHYPIEKIKNKLRTMVKKYSQPKKKRRKGETKRQ